MLLNYHSQTLHRLLMSAYQPLLIFRRVRECEMHRQLPQFPCLPQPTMAFDRKGALLVPLKLLKRQFQYRDTFLLVAFSGGILKCLLQAASDGLRQ